MKTKYNLILALLLMLITQISFAQEQPVSGVVSDQSGVPIPGVNVLVKGTSNSTQTDLDGKFKISANKSQTLIFSFLGMKTKEVLATDTSLSVKLESNSEQLSEVVINVLGVEVKKKSKCFCLF